MGDQIQNKLANDLIEKSLDKGYILNTNQYNSNDTNDPGYWTSKGYGKNKCMQVASKLKKTYKSDTSVSSQCNNSSCTPLGCFYDVKVDSFKFNDNSDNPNQKPAKCSTDNICVNFENKYKGGNMSQEICENIAHENNVNFRISPNTGEGIKEWSDTSGNIVTITSNDINDKNILTEDIDELSISCLNDKCAPLGCYRNRSVYMYNVGKDKRSYSNNISIDSRINSDHEWKGQQNNDWIKIDLEKNRNIIGFVIQGSPNEDKWVTSLSIEIENENGDQIKPTSANYNSQIFQGNKINNYYSNLCNDRNSKNYYYFSKTEVGSSIKFIIQSFNVRPWLRIAPLIEDDTIFWNNKDIEGGSTCNVEKECLCSPVTENQWELCAENGESCNFTGYKKVRYGTDHTNYEYKIGKDGIQCLSDNFQNNLYNIDYIVMNAFAHYDFNSFNENTLTWNDKTNNNNHSQKIDMSDNIIKDYTTKSIKGNLNSQIEFPENVIQNDFTIFVVAKYQDDINDNGPIFSDKENNTWYHGFSNGESGVFDYNGWKSSYEGLKNNTQFHIIGGSNNDENPIIVNGKRHDITKTLSTINGGKTLMINGTQNKTHWEIKEIIIWNRKLNLYEFNEVNRYLLFKQSYCHYNQDSFDKIRQVWYDKGINQLHSIKVNGNINVKSDRSLSGGQNDNIIFPPNTIPTNFTLFTIAKYNIRYDDKGNDISQHDQIFNTYKSNDWYHGFNNDKVGVGQYGKYFKKNHSAFNVEKNRWYINGGDNSDERHFTINGDLDNGLPNGKPGGKGNQQLTINYRSPSDWNVKEIIIWDRHLTKEEFKIVTDYFFTHTNQCWVKNTDAFQGNQCKTKITCLHENTIDKKNASNGQCWDLTNIIKPKQFNCKDGWVGNDCDKRVVKKNINKIIFDKKDIDSDIKTGDNIRFSKYAPCDCSGTEIPDFEGCCSNIGKQMVNIKTHPEFRKRFGPENPIISDFNLNFQQNFSVLTEDLKSEYGVCQDNTINICKNNKNEYLDHIKSKGKCESISTNTWGPLTLIGMNSKDQCEMNGYNWKELPNDVIKVNNTSIFSESGEVIINNEIIQYTGKTNNSLTGITRSTNTQYHSSGNKVYQVVDGNPRYGNTLITPTDDNNIFSIQDLNENSELIFSTSLLEVDCSIENIKGYYKRVNDNKYQHIDTSGVNIEYIRSMSELNNESGWRLMSEGKLLYVISDLNKNLLKNLDWTSVNDDKTYFRITGKMINKMKIKTFTNDAITVDYSVDSILLGISKMIDLPVLIHVENMSGKGKGAFNPALYKISRINDMSGNVEEKCNQLCLENDECDIAYSFGNNCYLGEENDLQNKNEWQCHNNDCNDENYSFYKKDYILRENRRIKNDCGECITYDHHTSLVKNGIYNKHGENVDTFCCKKGVNTVPEDAVPPNNTEKNTFKKHMSDIEIDRLRHSNNEWWYGNHFTCVKKEGSLTEQSKQIKKAINNGGTLPNCEIPYRNYKGGKGKYVMKDIVSDNNERRLYGPENENGTGIGGFNTQYAGRQGKENDNVYYSQEEVDSREECQQQCIDDDNCEIVYYPELEGICYKGTRSKVSDKTKWTCHSDENKCQSTQYGFWVKTIHCGGDNYPQTNSEKPAHMRSRQDDASRNIVLTEIVSDSMKPVETDIAISSDEIYYSPIYSNTTLNKGDEVIFENISKSNDYPEWLVKGMKGIFDKKNDTIPFFKIIWDRDDRKEIHSVKGIDIQKINKIEPFTEHITTGIWLDQKFKETYIGENGRTEPRKHADKVIIKSKPEWSQPHRNAHLNVDIERHEVFYDVYYTNDSTLEYNYSSNTNVFLDNKLLGKLFFESNRHKSDNHLVLKIHNKHLKSGTREDLINLDDIVEGTVLYIGQNKDYYDSYYNEDACKDEGHENCAEKICKEYVNPITQINYNSCIEKAREETCISQSNPNTGILYTSCENKTEEEACMAESKPDIGLVYTSCENKRYYGIDHADKVTVKSRTALIPGNSQVAWYEKFLQVYYTDNSVLEHNYGVNTHVFVNDTFIGKLNMNSNIGQQNNLLIIKVDTRIDDFNSVIAGINTGTILYIGQNKTYYDSYYNQELCREEGHKNCSEKLCKSQSNPNTNIIYTSCENKAREETCMSQSNPNTNIKYTSCENKANEEDCMKQSNGDGIRYISCENKKIEEACMSESNGDGVNYTSCQNKANEERCMSQSNPNTNINYTSCQNKADEEDCMTYINPYGTDWKLQIKYESCQEKNNKENECREAGYDTCQDKKYDEDKEAAAKARKERIEKETRERREDKCKNMGYDDCEDRKETESTFIRKDLTKSECKKAFDQFDMKQLKEDHIVDGQVITTGSDRLIWKDSINDPYHYPGCSMQGNHVYYNENKESRLDNGDNNTYAWGRYIYIIREGDVKYEPDPCKKLYCGGWDGLVKNRQGYSATRMYSPDLERDGVWKTTREPANNVLGSWWNYATTGDTYNRIEDKKVNGVTKIESDSEGCITNPENIRDGGWPVTENTDYQYHCKSPAFYHDDFKTPKNYHDKLYEYGQRLPIIDIKVLLKDNSIIEKTFNKSALYSQQIHGNNYNENGITRGGIEKDGNDIDQVNGEKRRIKDIDKNRIRKDYNDTKGGKQISWIRYDLGEIRGIKKINLKLDPYDISQYILGPDLTNELQRQLMNDDNLKPTNLVNTRIIISNQDIEPHQHPYIYPLYENDELKFKDRGEGYEITPLKEMINPLWETVINTNQMEYEFITRSNNYKDQEYFGKLTTESNKCYEYQHILHNGNMDHKFKNIYTGDYNGSTHLPGCHGFGNANGTDIGNLQYNAMKDTQLDTKNNKFQQTDLNAIKDRVRLSKKGAFASYIVISKPPNGKIVLKGIKCYDENDNIIDIKTMKSYPRLNNKKQKECMSGIENNSYCEISGQNDIYFQYKLVDNSFIKKIMVYNVDDLTLSSYLEGCTISIYKNISDKNPLWKSYFSGKKSIYEFYI